MTRCTYCRRLIFPWSRRGWTVDHEGVMRWHSRCRIAARLAVLA